MASVQLLFGQKVGYMNTQTVLAQIPEYVAATQTLEKMGKQYQDYIEGEKIKIDNAYRKYQADRPRLGESARQTRENEIISMERDLQKKQKEYFGEGGVMSAKSEELLNPIKEKVDAAVKKVAKERGLSLIIDVSVQQGVVYQDPEHDLSMEIVKNL